MAFSGWLYSGNEMDNLREKIENRVFIRIGNI